MRSVACLPSFLCFSIFFVEAVGAVADVDVLVVAECVMYILNVCVCVCAARINFSVFLMRVLKFHLLLGVHRIPFFRLPFFSSSKISKIYVYISTPTVSIRSYTLILNIYIRRVPI